MQRDIFFIILVISLLIGGCGGNGGTGDGSPGGTIRLAWDPPTTTADGSPLTDLTGYKIYYGTASRTYDHSVDVGNVTTYTLTGLAQGQTYYLATTAYDTSNRQSGFSNEVSGVAK
jgi:hypothetical protein